MSDLIDRQAAIEAVNNVTSKYIPSLRFGGEEIPLEVAHALYVLPSVKPERKKAKWENYIADTGVEHWRVIRCSECEKVAIDRYNYCPHCGARMNNE